MTPVLAYVHRGGAFERVTLADPPPDALRFPVFRGAIEVFEGRVYGRRLEGPVQRGARPPTLLVFVYSRRADPVDDLRFNHHFDFESAADLASTRGDL